ncbi:hypothetical protein BCR33DRAFT_718891 [Rhizoclosmatium globosum]|uniref:Uncharacterized protein n=1 Tax=Rhizoclosmatium globosum TaxID=329046 RepID=A0A1Y2C2K7_9FUNG|nr:hypothetical protein BCR33DRAFT_718891 [Rhizoclosmatium globosum]|eukprot:ORY41231.1 hypothetical protein BCR33DRAFT_718891 [Rhizoclosmatium globosum]
MRPDIEKNVDSGSATPPNYSNRYIQIPKIQSWSNSETEETWIKDIIAEKTSTTQITLKAPLQDAFFHWTFLCHPFNFRTMVKNMGWKIPSDTKDEDGATDPMTRAFEGFGKVLKDRVRQCLQDPQRFKMTLEVFEPHDLLILNFIEISRVCSFPWSEVVSDIRVDYERTRAHYSNVHNALVQSLDIVSKYHPTLLLTGGVPDPLQPEQVSPWKDLVQDLLQPTSAEGRILSSDEKMMRTKMFVLLTLPKDETLESVFTKTMTIPIQGYHGASNHHEDFRITFTFYAKKYKKNPPSSYFIVLSTSQDIFLNFTPPRRDEAEAEARRKGRTDAFGFHPGEGVGGGVIGVLANDFLRGCEEDPGRYSVLLKIRNPPPTRDINRGNESKKENLDGSVVRGETVTSGVLPPTSRQIDSLHGLTARNPPDLRRAKLVFSETVMYRRRDVLEIMFTETAREHVQVEYRLDTLYDTVRRKNPALMATLGKIPVPRHSLAALQPCSTYSGTRNKRPSESPTRIRGTNRPVIVVTKPIVSKEVIHDIDDPYKVGRRGQLNPHIVRGPRLPSKIPIMPPPLTESRRHKKKVSSRVYDVHLQRSRSNSPSRTSSRRKINLTKRASVLRTRPGSQLSIRTGSRLSTKRGVSPYRETKFRPSPTPSVRPWPEANSHKHHEDPIIAIYSHQIQSPT